ncbi:MAG: YeeE/YedE thiosulfate transporter family protein [Halioglobus sp.]
MINAGIGGILIGLAAVWLLLSLGRIAGISGIVANALRFGSDSAWAFVFILGLGIGGTMGAAWVDLETVHSAAAISVPLLLGGLLVGIGTRLGSGCTSGHGVCGVARFSLRSLVATATFLCVGMLTATMVYGL